MRMSRQSAFCIAAAILFSLITFARASWAVPAQLTQDGHPKLRIIVAPNASEQSRGAAAILADYLHRITGPTQYEQVFEVAAGDGLSDIAVGTAAEFPAIDTSPLDAKGLARKEQYLLRSHAKGLQVIAATTSGVEDAVWDLLYRVGYRHFSPGKHWEIIPSIPSLSIDLDVVEQPSFVGRELFHSYGTWPENRVEFDTWCKQNRLFPRFQLNTGHSYTNIVLQYKNEFAAHPEYYALVGGVRQQIAEPKFCISNQKLRDLVCDYAVKFLEENPQAETVSVEPSDGGGWCECVECAKFGSVSDQAVTLANQVAEAVTKKWPNKLVCMYAYNLHGPPPNIKVHPNVVVSVATEFLRGNLSFDQLLAGWREKGISQFGIREYYSIISWDHDLPGKAKGARPSLIASEIKSQYEQGARFMIAEASDNSGPNALGYLVASRALWDVKEADHVDAILHDFYEKAFGAAARPMKEFYELISGSKPPLLSDDLLGRMYGKLDQAWAAANDETVHARLGDLVLYTRYLELYRDYTTAAGADRQARFEAVIRHAYRIRSTHMVHSLGIYREGFRDSAVAIPADAGVEVPEGKNPWKSSAPFSMDDLKGMMKAGIASRKLLPFQPVSFSNDLRPATSLKLQKVDAGPNVIQSRGKRRYFTWVESAPTTIKLRVTDGLIAHYRDRGDATVQLFPANEAQGKPVAEAKVPPDGNPRDIELTSTHAGLHWIELSDGMDSSSIEWPSGMMFTGELTPTPLYDTGEQLYYFYVPKNTKVIGGYAAGVEGVLSDPAGLPSHTFTKVADYFSIPVSADKSGKLWSMRIRTYDSTLLFMTVPPYVARSGERLLLPKEVIEADQLRP